ncbi:MAG TPA: Uma2 family endonuclease [Gemmataceae bacterium]|nr:Uma2 family endonuclease [Gemmataceae bacterium]
MGTDRFPAKLLTAEEFYEWGWLPENEDRFLELVAGKVIEWPWPPGQRHGVVCGYLCWLLGEFTRRRNKGYVCSNCCGVILHRNPDTVRGPDLALYEDSKSYEELSDFYGDVPPRLAVEVLMPDDPPDLVAEKVTDYLTHGVPLLWLINTETRQATVHQPGKEPRILSGEEELTGGKILPGLSCRVADLFRLPWEAA